MANIDPYIEQIQNAVYGEEVRSSIINSLKKVNDDNESYAALKKDVIAAKDTVVEQVSKFDAKVSAAKATITALEQATSTANTAKTNLANATDTANTAKDNLAKATSTANTTKTNLEAATKKAGTAITDAGTAKTNLEKTITDAGTAKTQLQNVIDSANTLKTALSNTTGTANTTKTNLDTAIKNANTAKSQLQTVIDNAGTVKESLSGVIAQAATAKQNLDNSVATANAILQSLTAENTSAKSNLSELRSENFNSQEILAGVADLRAYLGLSDADILGLQVDYKNKTFTRIAGATNLTAGADFDAFPMYGGRKRCNVADDGTINAWFGDDGYTEDGSNGQVMVYQPKFYYLVCPVVYDPITTTGIGYHLRKANYYVSAKPRPGFRLHPAFYDANGNEVEYVMESAFEGSIFDASASAYLLDNEQVMDANADKFCSIAGARPATGHSQNLTRDMVEKLATNRGTGWHGDTIKVESASQLLMIIELGLMNAQNAIGQGVVNLPWTTGSDITTPYAAKTGSTSALGNGTGRATSTTTYPGNVETTDTANGKTSVSWRGKENPWGNLWKFVGGMNIYGNGKMDGGQPYICNDFNFNESKHDGNYEAAGFTVTPKEGYISAMGYSTACDWLFVASETNGNSNLPVGDYTYVTQNLNGSRIAQLGSYWTDGTYAGPFYWRLNNGVGTRARFIGGRLVYVPNAENQQTVTF